VTANAPHASILHVIHGLGSGVESVVQDYARNTPENHHDVLYSPDPTCHDRSFVDDPAFRSVIEVSSSPLQFVQSLQKTVRKTKPTGLLHG